MTEAAIQSPLARLTAGPRPTFEDSAALTQKRYRREGLLKGLGIGAIALALGLLGHPAVHHHRPGLAGLSRGLHQARHHLRPGGRSTRRARATRRCIGQANFAALINDSLDRAVPRRHRAARTGAWCAASSAPAPPTQLREMVQADPSLIGQTKEVWLVADDEVDQFAKGAIDRDAAEADRRLSDQALGLLDRLEADGRLETPLQPHLLHHAATRASRSWPASTAPCGARPT